MAGMVDEVRRFNRTVTQRVGSFNDHFLGRDRPLAEARLLWEIGPEGCEVRVLRSRLELDSGHASRLLRSLEADGLVNVVPSKADRRVRTAQLTPAGAAERAVLDQRSDELASSFLNPLAARQRRRLIAAMRDVERLLTAATVEIGPVDPTHPDAAPSEIKRMWVAESVRGLGIGRRLLTELEACAKRSGARAVRLETNRALTEAIALYRSAGFREV